MEDEEGVRRTRTGEVIASELRLGRSETRLHFLRAIFSTQHNQRLLPAETSP